MKKVEAETYVRVLNHADSEYRYELSPYTLGEYKCCIVQLSRCDKTAMMKRLGRVGAKLRLAALGERHSRMSEQCFNTLYFYS